MVYPEGKKCGVILLALMLLTTLVVAAIGCEERRGSIEGEMFDKDGKPVAGAIIRAAKSGYPSALLETDEDGYYSINNVLAGKWAVEFYNSNGRQIGLEEVTVKTGEITRLNFTIGAKPPPEHPAKLYFDKGK